MTGGFQLRRTTGQQRGKRPPMSMIYVDDLYVLSIYWAHPPVISPISLVSNLKLFYVCPAMCYLCYGDPQHFPVHREMDHHPPLLFSQRWYILWRHQMETFSALLALCAGNSPVTGEFPAQRPVMRSFDVFFVLRLNERFSKQSWGWWIETPSRPLWRHSNDNCLYGNCIRTV